MLFPLLVSMLLGQGQAQVQTPPLVAARPSWIEGLPEVPGRLYALGTADLGGNEGQAITRASARARLEVVTRLRVTVKGQTLVATRTNELQREGGVKIGSGERQVRDEVSVSTQAEDLPGLVVERTFVDAEARSAYALAYLDLAQAERTLASRLGRVKEGRARVGAELSRKVRWRLRSLMGELDRLDQTLGLLSLTGTGLPLRSELQAERTLVEARLAVLDQATLPPLDFAKLTVGFRSNLELPSGLEAYLAAQLGACGVVYRELSPEVILDLTFSGGAKGPEFIFVDLDIYQGVSYRLDLRMSLLDESGTALCRPAQIQIVQSSSPEGMVKEFRKQFDRRLPRLLTSFRNELQ